MVCPRRSWALWSLDGIEHLFDTGKPRFERIATERIAAGMKFARTYSTTGDPYAGIAFEPRTSRIVNPDGKVVWECTKVLSSNSPSAKSITPPWWARNRRRAEIGLSIMWITLALIVGFVAGWSVGRIHFGFQMFTAAKIRAKRDH